LSDGCEINSLISRVVTPGFLKFTKVFSFSNLLKKPAMEKEYFFVL